MDQTVVVGVTAAEGSRRAVEWAARRAADRQGRLLLISVIGEASRLPGEDAVVDAALAATQGLLDERAATAQAFGVDVDVRVERGKPVDRLIDASEHAALLVIGSDYRGPGSPLARGPHGVRITAGAHCPVVVIPDVDLGDRSGVVVGVDGSDVSEQAIRFAAAEADRAGEPLIPVIVWSPVAVPLELRSLPDDYRVGMQQIAEETLGISLTGLREDYPDLDVRPVVESGGPEAVISRVAERSRLVVLGSHGRGAIARFLLGSTTQTLLQKLPAPTAVVR